MNDGTFENMFVIFQAPRLARNGIKLMECQKLDKSWSANSIDMTQTSEQLQQQQKLREVLQPITQIRLKKFLFPSS